MGAERWALGPGFGATCSWTSWTWFAFALMSVPIKRQTPQHREVPYSAINCTQLEVLCGSLWKVLIYDAWIGNRWELLLGGESFQAEGFFREESEFGVIFLISWSVKQRWKSLCALCIFRMVWDRNLLTAPCISKQKWQNMTWLSLFPDSVIHQWRVSYLGRLWVWDPIPTALNAFYLNLPMNCVWYLLFHTKLSSLFLPDFSSLPSQGYHWREQYQNLRLILLHG